MTRLLNKVAIITGSSSGLGRAIAIEFAKQGAKIVCADFKPEARSQIPSETETSTHELIQKNGGEAIFQKTDVTVASEVEELVKATVEKWGKVDM